MLGYQSIRYSYVDWGTFNHRLFLQSPSKQKGKERSTNRENRKVETLKNGSIVPAECTIYVNVVIFCIIHIQIYTNNAMVLFLSLYCRMC